MVKLPLGIKTLREVFLKVAAADTSCNPEAYKKCQKVSPLFLHCAAVATTVQGIYGGDIVTGRIKGIQHYWNRIAGREIDLTSCQFGGDGFTPLMKGRKIKTRKHTNPRFLVFAMRVWENL